MMDQVYLLDLIACTRSKNDIKGVSYSLLRINLFCEMLLLLILLSTSELNRFYCQLINQSDIN